MSKITVKFQYLTYNKKREYFNRNIELSHKKVMQLLTAKNKEQASEVEGWESFKNFFLRIFKRESAMKQALKAIYEQINTPTEHKTVLNALDKINRISFLALNKLDFLKQIQFKTEAQLNNISSQNTNKINYFPQIPSHTTTLQQEENPPEQAFYLSIGDHDFGEKAFFLATEQEAAAIFEPSATGNIIRQDVIDHLCFLSEFDNDNFGLLMNSEVKDSLTRDLETYGTQTSSVKVEFWKAVRDNEGLSDKHGNEDKTVKRLRLSLQHNLSGVFENKPNIRSKVVKKAMALKLKKIPLNDEALDKAILAIVNKCCKGKDVDKKDIVYVLILSWYQNAKQSHDLNVLDQRIDPSTGITCLSHYKDTIETFYRTIELEETDANCIIKNDKLNPIVGVAIKSYVINQKMATYLEKQRRSNKT